MYWKKNDNPLTTELGGIGPRRCRQSCHSLSVKQTLVNHLTVCLVYFRDINNYVYTYGRCLELFHITFIHYSLIRFYKGGDNAEYFRTAIYFAETVWCLKTMDYDSV